MFLHCQYCPFAATCCKKLSAFSILNSYTIYRPFPVTHADTYTLTDTQVCISLSLARYPFAGRGNTHFHCPLRTKPILPHCTPLSLSKPAAHRQAPGDVCVTHSEGQLLDRRLSELWPRCTGIIYSNCT